MRVGICAIVLLNSCLACLAQSKYYFVEETTIRADMQNQFERAQKEYCAAVVRGGAPSCLVLSPSIFSQPNHYLILLSFASFAHYDQGTYTSKGLTPEQARDLSSRRAPTIASNVESVIERKEPTTITQSELTSLALITEVHLAPGTAPAFLELIRSFDQLGVYQGAVGDFEIYQTVANGDPDRLFIIQHLHKFAELDTVKPILSVVPAARRRIFSNDYAKYVRSISVTVMDYREDLSSVAK